MKSKEGLMRVHMIVSADHDGFLTEWLTLCNSDWLTRKNAEHLHTQSDC